MIKRAVFTLLTVPLLTFTSNAQERARPFIWVDAEDR